LNRETYKTSTKKSLSKPRPARPVGNLGSHLFSFSAALISTAPAGLGVFELLFVKAMPDVPRLKVLSALLVFRLFYLIIPLLIAIVVVIVFERGKLVEGENGRRGDTY
jgi:hypothetical protein